MVHNIREMAEKQSSDRSPSPPPLDILVEDSPKMTMWMNPVPMECGVLSGGDRSTPRFTISVSILYTCILTRRPIHTYTLIFTIVFSTASQEIVSLCT